MANGEGKIMKSIQENGYSIRQMGMEDMIIKMEDGTKVSLRIILSMVKAKKVMRMEIFMMVILLMINLMDLEYIDGLMVHPIMEHFVVESDMVKVIG